ncbi:MAG: hypothetical protein ABEK50_18840 [bacterium]
MNLPTTRLLTTTAIIPLLILVSAIGAWGQTTQTDVTVHVISKGAKFIGSGVGGARVKIYNAETGDLLSKGITTGGSGNTKRIMKSKHDREKVLSTTDAAGFSTSLWLEEPTRLKITAFGPLNHKDDANTATVTTKVYPGKDLNGGDGVLIEIPGFVVDIISPDENYLREGENKITFEALVTMMCGCSLKPGGIWDSNGYDITLDLYKDGERLKRVPMEYTGTPSHFRSTIELEERGCYTVYVNAHDPVTGNTGWEKTACHKLN